MEAGKAAYKEFIRTDLVSAVNSEKNAFINTDKHVYNYKSQLHTFGKRTKYISEMILGILQEEEYR